MKLALVRPQAGLIHHSQVGAPAEATKIKISKDFFILLVGNTPREALIAVGGYNLLTSIDYAKGLPSSIPGIIRLEARYATFDGRVSSEEAVKAIIEADPDLPFAPAGFDVTAAFGASFPDQQKSPIVGLELVPTDDEHYGVTCLSTYGEKRRIHIVSRYVKWPTNFRFLIIRPFGL